MKFCTDCRWFVPKLVNGLPDAEFSKCRYIDRRHMVTGEPDYWYAVVMRTSTAADRCGPDASFFMPAQSEGMCDGE
jgi:hypothetical protein